MTKRAVLLLSSLALILIAIGCVWFSVFESEHRYESAYEWMSERLVRYVVSFTMFASGAAGIGLFVAALFAVRDGRANE